MRTGEVGVEVDHLGLEPQSELHAAGAHDVDEGPEALRPHLIVDVPVAESGIRLPATAEPSVVEDDALDPDLCRALDEGGQPARS